MADALSLGHDALARTCLKEVIIQSTRGLVVTGASKRNGRAIATSLNTASSQERVIRDG